MRLHLCYICILFCNRASDFVNLYQILRVKQIRDILQLLICNQVHALNGRKLMGSAYGEVSFALYSTFFSRFSAPYFDGKIRGRHREVSAGAIRQVAEQAAGFPRGFPGRELLTGGFGILCENVQRRVRTLG